MLGRLGCFCFLFLAVGCGGEPAKPPPVTPGPPRAGIRYLAGGDSRDDKSRVLPWAFREARARGAKAFLFLGDMELTPQLDSHFRNELRDLDPVPFYPVLGNHEIRLFGFAPIGVGQAEKEFRQHFLDTARTPVHSSLPGRVVYSVNLPGGLHFVALDNVSQKGFGPDQLAWLASDLERARADARVRFVIVGMHKPFAKNGVSTHGMDQDGEPAIADSDAALALLQKHRVSLILASHVHEFAELEQGGIKSYITGGLGAPLDRSGPEHAFHHFLESELGEKDLTVSVVRFDGKPTLADGEMED